MKAFRRNYAHNADGKKYCYFHFIYLFFSVSFVVEVE